MSQKENVLKMLEQNRGKTLSGEEIGKNLAITRAAVWKAINSLREDGYPIEAKTNGGYIIRDDCDIISASALQALLPNYLDSIFVFDTLTSTNAYALKLAEESAPHGTLVVARTQSSGRGRIGKTFESPVGGIYMSIVLRPNCRIQDATLITPMVAVAVANAITTLTPLSPRIKWVNDLYLDGKKVCGILTQALSDFENGNVRAVVVGIGINFDTPLSLFDTALQQKVTSMFLSKEETTNKGHLPDSHPTISKTQLISQIHTNIVDFARNLKDKAFMSRYRELSLVVGKTVQFEYNSVAYSGMVEGIDDNARLRVRTEQGDKILDCGEVSISTDNGWI